MTSRRHVLTGYFIWVILLVAAYYRLPSLRVETWGLIGLSGVAGIVAGIVINQEVIRRGSEAYFRTLVQDTSDAILIVGDDGKVRYATPSATSIFGDIGVEGAYLWDLVKDGERDDVARALTRMREHVGRTSYYEDMRITRRDDIGVQVQVRCSDLRGDSTVGGLVLTLRDVTAQRQLEDELKHRAFHDALTGLPNRVLFQDRAGQRPGPDAARRDDGRRALRGPGRLQGRERHDGP